MSRVCRCVYISQCYLCVAVCIPATEFKWQVVSAFLRYQYARGGFYGVRDPSVEGEDVQSTDTWSHAALQCASIKPSSLFT